jgi:predicted ATP-dependent endonuclease of OLD family
LAVKNKASALLQITVADVLEMIAPYMKAGITTEELENPDSYEEIKAELEAVSLDISNKVFKYWKQNSQLQVEFDVKTDPNEEAPFNSGANLYIRVKNLEHGVSVPFDQRSKGFVWFFSFIVWFNSVQNRIGTDKELVLLLDEPGLSLHGLAQADFLHYIDDLSKEHQILYTTHSPFMIDSEKLHQVRTVEDVKGKGTVVSGSLSSTDKRTLFPLQAGLGYSLAQNLFIGAKNVLVEGPADLIFWKYFSTLLEQDGRTSLDSEGNYQSIVEKPTAEEAPSNLINVSKYLLPKQIIDACVTVNPNPQRGEYELTDVVNSFVSSGGKVAVIRPEGQYLDCGTPDGWLKANNTIMAS